MFYLTSEFHDNCVNTFGFMEGGGGGGLFPQSQELQKSPGRIGLIKYLFQLLSFFSCFLFAFFLSSFDHKQKLYNL